ncbi:MAG: ABC transporter ATP-binding protein [Chloroflexota bacterium]
MSLLTGSNLAKSYGAQDVFAGVNVTVPHNARIALVGPNGAGKTTLLRILCGLEEPSAGEVSRARGLTLGYLPQEAHLDGDLTLYQAMLEVFADLRAQEEALRQMEMEMADPSRFEALAEKYSALSERFEQAGGYTYEVRIRQVLGGLGFDVGDFHRPLSQLSGGQKTRALLARLLLEAPALLVLDEPTNHLDIQAVEWLEETLTNWPGAILLVSHDRYFLDRLVNTVWELENGRLEVYSGNYSAYVRQRAERRARQQAEYEAQQAYIARTEAYIRRYKAGQRAREARGREKRLERLAPVEKPHEQPRLHLDLRPDLRSGDKVLETHGLVVGYPEDGPLFTCPDLLLWRGECAALIGPNGAGKTTFLRTILQQIPPLAGEARLGASVKVGYFAQAHEGLHPDWTPLQEILAAQEMLMSQARHYLARFLFSGDDVFKPIAALSGGERGRLALALLALQGANFLLLDEPTNHLDIPSQEVLQEALAAFEGTILLVSHDRYLIDALATQVWVLEGGELRVYPGGYTEVVQAREGDGRRTTDGGRRKTGDRQQAQTTALRPPSSVLRQMRERAAELEAIIAELESRLAQVSHELEQAGLAQQLDRVRALGAEYTQLEAELQARLDEWADLASRVEV